MWFFEVKLNLRLNDVLLKMYFRLLLSTSNRRMNVWSSSYSRSVWHRVDAACLVHALEASTVRLLSLHWCLTNENSMTCSRPPEPRGMTQISRSASCSEWMIHSRSCDTTAKATRRLNASWCKGRASRGGVCVWKQFPMSRTCQYILKHLWLHYKPVFTHQITLQHTNVSRQMQCTWWTVKEVTP